MDGFVDACGRDLREFVDRLLRFESLPQREAPANEWIAERLATLGFETYHWSADAAELAKHPSFPEDPADVTVADRPSVAGVLELGDPDAGPTLVLNGHVDVVPAEGEWTADPFTPQWRGEGSEAAVTARGAADMKAGLGALVYAARYLADRAEDLDGRLVVESVVGEEEGGIGAAAAALDAPYPFERDAAIVAEPTSLTPVVACEGCLMKRLELSGRAAHAATPWRGESVLPRFEAIRQAFDALERERAERVTHPLYGEFRRPWPVLCGTVRAGTWPASVPAALTAEWRIGVAPGEIVTAVEAAFEERLADVVAADDWLDAHPPGFDRFDVQFEPSEVDPGDPVVEAVRAALRARGREDDPRGVTYGTDARHYIEAGIPTLVFGPGDIEQAHFPDETIAWREVLAAGRLFVDAARRFLQSSSEM
jgi:acetylornithine deacetylase